MTEVAKSIVEKLRLQQYARAAVLNQPEDSDYFAALSGFDTSLQEGSYDLIFAFVRDAAALKQLVEEVIAGGRLNKQGYLFAAYPKKGNRKYETYIHRDDLFGILGSDEEGYIGDSGVKFARMVGLDDVFTVVGFKEDAAGKAKLAKARMGMPAEASAAGSAAPAEGSVPVIVSGKPSQRVGDYVAMIPDVEHDLAAVPELLAIYQGLTPGYRKDWARYIYSAKQEETRQKRRDEMKVILKAGYKSRELYRKDHS